MSILQSFPHFALKLTCFSIMSVTPGTLVSYAVCRWIWGFFDARKGLHIGRKQDELRRALRYIETTQVTNTFNNLPWYRNINRILTSASPTDHGRLSYKDYGKIICESELLLRKAKISLKDTQYRELQEDIRDLVNIQHGVYKQLKIAERMGWVYSSDSYR